MSATCAQQLTLQLCMAAYSSSHVPWKGPLMRMQSCTGLQGAFKNHAVDQAVDVRYAGCGCQYWLIGLFLTCLPISHACATALTGQQRIPVHDLVALSTLSTCDVNWIRFANVFVRTAAAQCSFWLHMQAVTGKMQKEERLVRSN